MKLITIIFCIIVLVGCSFFAPEGASSTEELKNLCEKYSRNNSVKKMFKLYCLDGLDSSRKNNIKRTLQRDLSYSFESLESKVFSEKEAAFFNKTVSVQNQLISYNLKIIGQITVMADNNRAINYMYGKKDDAYFLTAQKIEFISNR